MSKHFLLNPYKGESPKEQIEEIRRKEEFLLRYGDDVLDRESMKRFMDDDNLKHTEGRIVCKVDMQMKNRHRFENGVVIRRERQFNEFNRRITEPVNVFVISGEGIPKGAEMLVEHNALHETNRINDYKNHFENDGSDRIRYFSIPRYECFAWRENGGEWHPIYPYQFGLRLFRPYNGVLQGIEPTKIKDTLFVTSGRYKGLVVKTLIACDYQIIYQDTNGRENYLIVFRPDGEEKSKREREAIAILHDITKEVNDGEILVGYEIKDAKPIEKVIENNFNGGIRFKSVTVL